MQIRVNNSIMLNTVLPESKCFRRGINTFITRYHSTTKVTLFWINDASNLVSIGATAHGRDVKLIQFGHFLQKLPTVWPQSCMVSDVRMFTECKTIHILQKYIL